MTGSPLKLGFVALVVGLVVAVMGVFAPALAQTPSAPDGRISSTESTAGRLQFAFSGLGLPPNTTIDPATVKVTLDGTSAKSAATPVASAPIPKKRVAILTIDTSGSMRIDNRLAKAKEAANAFLDEVPDDVEVGLVKFGSVPSTVVSPTLDRAAVREEVDALTVAGQTALYAGTALAVKEAGTEGFRSILLLSDGGETENKAGLPATAALVKKSGVTLDAVALGLEPSQLAALDTLAEAGGGQVIRQANSADLTKTFTAAAQALSSQVSVNAVVPEALRSGGLVNLRVTANAGGQVISDDVLTTLVGFPVAGPGTDPVPVASPQPPPFINQTTLIAAIAALFLGLAGILGVAFVTAGHVDSRETRVRRRLSIYSLSGRQPVKQEETTTALGHNPVARSAVELAGKVVAQRGLDSMLSHRLEAAGVPLRAAEWILIHVGTAIGLSLLLLLLSGGGLAATLAGLVIGLALPYIYLNIKESRRIKAFLSQLPDTLQLIAGSLSAGYSLAQAVDTVVREGQTPMSTELNRALVESRLGMPIEDGLESVGTRMRSRDFEWVVIAIRIQREVGGNLAEVLHTVSETLRERERLRRQVGVLSAEGKLSGWILGLLPPVFAMYLIVVRPAYLRPLIETPIGWLMIGMGLLLLTVGGLWMRKAVKVEV